MNAESQRKESFTATFKWYGRILMGALLLGLLVAGLSMLSAKRAEGVVAAAVSVVNSQLSVDTEYPARIPFQASLNVLSDGSLETVVPAQPTDKLFVIEDVDGYCSTAGTIPVNLALNTTVLENADVPPFGIRATLLTISHEIVPVYLGATTDGQYHWSFHEHTHYYNAPGAMVGASSNTLGASGYCNVVVSGYLVKPPA
jgi:hypothetical protein